MPSKLAGWIAELQC